MFTYMAVNKRVKGGKGTFGALIERLRLEREWSISRLATEAKLSATRIVDIEKMETPDGIYGQTVEKLATAFGMDPPALRRLYEEAREKMGRGSIMLPPEVSDQVRERSSEVGAEPVLWLTELVGRASVDAEIVAKVREHAGRTGTEPLVWLNEAAMLFLLEQPELSGVENSKLSDVVKPPKRATRPAPPGTSASNALPSNGKADSPPSRASAGSRQKRGARERSKPAADRRGTPAPTAT